MSKFKVGDKVRRTAMRLPKVVRVRDDKDEPDTLEAE